MPMAMPITMATRIQVVVIFCGRHGLKTPVKTILKPSIQMDSKDLHIHGIM